MANYADYFKGKDFVHQLGFYAPDWRKFCEAHHRVFGSGPFYYTTNTFGKLIYRGEEVDCKGLKFHAAYGGWGSHSVEVVQQDPVDVMTMFRDGGDMDKPSYNHMHLFVDDLEEARDACEFLKIPVVTIGWGDLENARKKAEQTGVPWEEVKKNAEKPSFMVVDMRDELGTMVQLIGPNAKKIHDLLIKSRAEWDGDESTLFRPLGG